MGRKPKVGDIVLVAYLDPNYTPRLEPHPAIVVRVREPDNAESRLDLVVFHANIAPPAAAGANDIPYSPTPAVDHWSWPPDDPAPAP